MSSKKTKDRLFWPPERIAALQAYVRGESMPEDAFERGQMAAWCREYIALSPSWLHADQLRLRLKVHAQDAISKLQAALSEVDSLLSSLENMKPLESEFQDKWAQRIVNAMNEPPNPPERPVMDPDKPAGVEKIPAPEQKLPSEVMFDRAHGKPEGGPTEIPLGEKLAKMKPDALRRVVGPTYGKVAVPVEETEEQRLARVGYPQAESENFEEERIVHPNPEDEHPEQHHEQGEAKSPRSLKVAEWPRAHEATSAPAAPRAETVKVKREDGTIMHRRPRTGFRMELKRIAEDHGEEVSSFLVSNFEIGKSTEKIRKVMAKFGGTYSDMAMARTACAAAQGIEQDGFVLSDHAKVLEHEDGRCSWWNL